ncbi:NosD domain-containing protein [Desulfatibacillum aliphaticivorans]|uniref:NosD domain-containing protein n=1 Tax=Desulfatibacillum aliphaticivorans TaxID=218208 RepID=UPI000415D959|nr:NosD domain-containing protein [Desulfatibacillum aliphaticivorans]
MIRRVAIFLVILCVQPLNAAYALNVEYSSPSHVQVLLSRWPGDLGSVRKVELFSGDSEQAWIITGTWGGMGDVTGETFADLAVGPGVHYLRAKYYRYDSFEEIWTLEETQTLSLNKISTFGTLRPSLTGIGMVTWSNSVWLSDEVVVEDGTLVIEPDAEVTFLDTASHGAILRISDGALLKANKVSFRNGVSSSLYGEVICESDASSGLQQTLISNSTFHDVDLVVVGSNLLFMDNICGQVEIKGNRNVLTGSTMGDLHLSYASEALVQDNTLDSIVVGYNTATCISNTILANKCEFIIFPDTLNTSDGNVVESNETGRIFIGGKNNRVINNKVSCKEWEPAIVIANEGNEVRGNKLSDCQDKGIEVSSSDNIIHRNIIKNCGDTGLFLRAFTPGAVGNEITENEILGCLGDGIAIYGGQNTVIKGNKISNCDHPLLDGDAGIALKDFNPYVASANLVTENEIESCEIGILSQTSAPSNEPLSANQCEDNQIAYCEVGVWVKSGLAVVTNNAFVENDTHALDEWSVGVWNLALSDAERNIVGGPFWGGNYYSGYSAPDVNGDYIADEPYAIYDLLQTIETYDQYPLLIPRQIAVSPKSYDFGGLIPGAYSSVLVEFGNAIDSLDSLEVSNVQLTGPGAFSLDLSPVGNPCEETNLFFSPGDACNVLVAFSPAGLGQFDAVLTISSDDPDEPEFEATFTGKGVALPGDANGDYVLSLADAILILKVCAGLKPSELFVEGLANGSDFVPDDILQVNDALGILQTIALSR